jgi:NitT/TauT family transport system ATP-binding protein
MSKRPGRPKLVVDINLPRPRDIIGIQGDPAYGAYFKQLWAALDVH